MLQLTSPCPLFELSLADADADFYRCFGDAHLTTPTAQC